jgi:putative flippase GtrA
MLSVVRIVRYFLAGGGSLALDLGVQAVFLQLAGLPVWLASGASYELALLAHFLLNESWVFGRRRRSLRRLAEFQVAALTGAAITYVVTNVLVYGPTAPTFGTGLGPYVAKTLGTVLAVGWTFASSFFWIWRVRPAPAGAAPAVAPPPPPVRHDLAGLET